MQKTVEAETLANALEMLKKRNGRSFEALARRLSMSKSTLHRYAAGETVPARWAIVEAWAQECGATDEEVAELQDIWRRTASHAPAPQLSRRQRSRWWLIAVAAMIVAAATGAVTYASVVVKQRHIAGASPTATEAARSSAPNRHAVGA